MEAFKENFIFILWTGWILLSAAIFFVGCYSSMIDEKHPFYKYRLKAWITIVLFWVVMFVL